jgi:hypothetical protein
VPGTKVLPEKSLLRPLSSVEIFASHHNSRSIFFVEEIKAPESFVRAPVT